MTSFLDVIAADDTQVRLASRKAVVAAKQRVDAQFGQFIAKYGEPALEYAKDDIRGLVLAAADEFGANDGDTIFESVLDYLKATINPPEPKTASTVHEARRVKMCPFHKDVVDISLAQGEAQAGFSAMAQHWGGPRHCEGDGYEGDKCNFKPAMTTQAFWDERKEKAEQRKREREEQAELEAQQPIEEVAEDAPVVEDVAEDAPADNVVEVEFGGDNIGPEPVAEAEVPMSMAASTKEAGKCSSCGCECDGDTCPECGGKVSKTAAPVPTMDKRKWTPQTVKEIDTEGDDSPHPTKRKDVVDGDKPENGTRFNPSKLTEIGEGVTERQDVSTDTNPSADGPHTDTWTEGPKSAISSLIESDFDGFLPQADAQRAVLAHRNR